MTRHVLLVMQNAEVVSRTETDDLNRYKEMFAVAIEAGHIPVAIYTLPGGPNVAVMDCVKEAGA